MPIPLKTIETLVQEILAEYRTRLPGQDTGLGSELYVRAVVLALQKAHVTQHALYLLRQLLPPQADEAVVSKWAAMCGLARKAPTRAAGILVVTGAGTLAGGELLTAPNGQTVTVDAGGAIAGPTETAVTAVDAGVAGNLPGGTVMTFASPPAGIDGVALVKRAGGTLTPLSGGSDLETIAQLADRVTDYLANPPGSGNDADYRRWMLAVPGCTRGFVYPLRRGRGTVDVVVQGEYVAGGLSGRVAPGVKDKADASVQANRPNTANVQMVALTTQDVEVEIAVTPDGKHPWDWTGTMTCTSTPGSATTLDVASVPAGVVQGARLVWVPTSGASRIQQIAKVASVAGLVITLEAPGFTTSPHPEAGDTIYPGGPLSDPIAAALLGEGGAFDRLTPGDTLVPSRFPEPSTDQPDTLVRGQLAKAVLDVSGVYDCEIVLPVATVTPDPLKVLVPSRLLVRPI